MSEHYSRLYHRFSSEFPEVYANDAALAAWVRLLMLADASWPLRPPMPRSTGRKGLSVLVSAGLVTVDGDTYSVRGLEAERGRRSASARVGASKRWQSERTANADASADANAMQTHSERTANAMPRRDETRREGDERDSPPPPAERGRRKDGTNPRATGSDPRSNGSNPRANGTSTRDVRRDQKTGPTQLGSILRSTVAVADEDDEPWM